MKKTLLASAIALSLGSATSVQAITITITNMNFNGVHSASGTMNDVGNGSMTDTTVPGFFGSQWTADQQAWFDTHSSTVTWAGTGSTYNTTDANGAFSYTFHLTGNQVAAGVFFDWSGSNNIPVLTIYDCPVSGGGACTGASLPMQTLPFLGQQPSFNGSTTCDVSAGLNDSNWDDSSTGDSCASEVVPVPAAAWLLGSGLLGLVGVARRKKA